MATIPLRAPYESGVYSFVPYKFHEEFNVYPLSNSVGYLVLLVAAYLTFVLKIGPDHMKNRPPYQLKTPILVYNALQVVLSALFVFLNLKSLILGGLFPRTSIQNEDPEMRKMMFIGVYFYFLGKITELADTVFFVLRKKDNQVTFLHVYHHASVIIGTWIITFASLNQTVVYGVFINSLVHVVMYFYYFMAALGPQYQKYLTWKKYITTFQLVQFVSMWLHQVICLFVTRGEHTVIGVTYVIFSTTLFFKLFSDFYKSSYKKSAVYNKNNGCNEICEDNGEPSNEKSDVHKNQNGIANVKTSKQL